MAKARLRSPHRMIQSQLITRIAELNPHLTQEQVDAVVRTILRTLTDALTQGDWVELRHFGSFAVTPMRARQARNPKTGARVDVPARSSVRFKAGKAMRERLRDVVGPASAAAELHAD